MPRARWQGQDVLVQAQPRQVVSGCKGLAQRLTALRWMTNHQQSAMEAKLWKCLMITLKLLCWMPDHQQFALCMTNRNWFIVQGTGTAPGSPSLDG